MTFKDLQDETKRRATRDQSGTTFDTGIKNIINFSLFRLAREAPWRVLRRKTTFDTVTSYVTGTSATMTSGSPIVTVAGSTFITDGVNVGRKVKVSASGTYYFIKNISGETSMTLDQTFYGTSNTAATYEILPQEEYNLPIEASHRLFMWHEASGYPEKLSYITDQDFFDNGIYLIDKGDPTHYRMWGEDMVLASLRTESTVSVISTSASDTAKEVTVFGTVAGYPDYETISTNGASGLTSVAGAKIFSSIERVVKNASTTGRIICFATGLTVSVIPAGDITAGVLYKKIQLYPLPDSVFPIHVQYYKDPYRLVNDNDIHEMGQEFDEALILLATAKMKAEQNLQTESDRFYAYYADELRTLKKHNIDKLDWYPTLRRPGQGHSDSFVVPGLLFKQAGSNFGPASRM